MGDDGVMRHAVDPGRTTNAATRRRGGLRHVQNDRRRFSIVTISLRDADGTGRGQRVHQKLTVRVTNPTGPQTVLFSGVEGFEPPNVVTKTRCLTT